MIAFGWVEPIALIDIKEAIAIIINKFLSFPGSSLNCIKSILPSPIPEKARLFLLIIVILFASGWYLIAGAVQFELTFLMPH